MFGSKQGSLQLNSKLFESNSYFNFSFSPSIQNLDSIEVLSKISVIFSILFMLKEFKFKYINELQPLNILSILVTKEVSKLDKSNDKIFSHPENIYCILVVEPVLKLDKSIVSKLLQL